MPISQKDIKILWAGAAGHCSFTDCGQRLYLSAVNGALVIGEMAHIKGDKPTSSRYDSNQLPEERQSYSNLILLCPTHHTTIDKPENEATYTVDVLVAMKAKHEAHILARVGEKSFSDKAILAAHLFPLLVENHQAFLAFGPHSEIARKNPQSDAHILWQAERLCTIVPNNRRVASAIAKNTNLFSPDEQAIVARFLAHARSYELWVKDDISYEGVVRFPIEFDEMIKRLSNASK